MQIGYFILISVMIGACIGGITNYLAIKMLFHPRHKMMLAGYKLPFTPGLIPKRKDEISIALGRIVSDYLVTTAGLTALLNKPQFRAGLKERFANGVQQWLQSGEKVEDLLNRWWTTEQLERFRLHAAAELSRLSASMISALWDKQEQASLTLGELLPHQLKQQKEQLVQKAAAYILGEVKRELQSEAGERLLRQLLDGILTQAGGMLGTLASMFIDEEKVAAKIRQMVTQWLGKMEVQNKLAELLLHEWLKWERVTVSEALHQLTGEEGRAWLLRQADVFLQWDSWIKRVLGLQLDRWLDEPKVQGLIAIGQKGIEFLLACIAANIERIVAAIELPQLVEEQVRHFPIERVEQIILSVSGKEFRAITWLGALLGGMIGLLQSAVLQLLR